GRAPDRSRVLRARDREGRGCRRAARDAASAGAAHRVDRNARGRLMATSTRFVPVAKVGDVAPGEVVVIEAEGRSLALGRTEDGRFGVIDNVCTHDGGTLREGALEGACVECPRPGGRVDLFTRVACSPPPVVPDTPCSRAS